VAASACHSVDEQNAIAIVGNLTQGSKRLQHPG
jgi:hypothetical protein